MRDSDVSPWRDLSEDDACRPTRDGSRTPNQIRPLSRMRMCASPIVILISRSSSCHFAFAAFRCYRRGPYEPLQHLDGVRGLSRSQCRKVGASRSHEDLRRTACASMHRAPVLGALTPRVPARSSLGVEGFDQASEHSAERLDLGGTRPREGTLNGALDGPRVRDIEFSAFRSELDSHATPVNLVSPPHDELAFLETS